MTKKKDGRERTVRRKLLLTAGLLFDLGVLFYYKYYDFFIENVNSIFKTEHTLLGLILPLGISFFTFQQISFIIDTYRGEVPKYRFIEYASFVAFFPQLIAGPIVTHDELVPQFMDQHKKRFNWDNFSKGMFIFTLGMAKKVLIADSFGNAANWGFANVEALDATNAIISMLAYTIQIYFDFSGYCDMAIGLGKMFNVDLPINFNSPYKSFTIKEFWERWHMTLTRFFTRYVYIPLGGSRKGSVRTYVNIMIVFAVSGLWHGADWTFVIWGILHGGGSVLNRYKKDFFEKLHPAFNWLMTFTYINLAWVLFRTESIGDAVTLVNRIVMMKFGAINENIVSAFGLPEFTFIASRIPVFGSDLLSVYPNVLLFAAFVFVFALMLGCDNAYEKMNRFRPSAGNLAGIVILFVWCVFSFSGISTFLYFNF